MAEQLTVLTRFPSGQLWHAQDRNIADLPPDLDHKRLVYCFPGSFDLPKSYDGWTNALSGETDADVVVHDFRDTPGVRQVSGGEGRHEAYRADFRPADRFNILANNIAYKQPAEVALVGYGEGAIDALIGAYALRFLKFPVSCAVAVAPTLSFGQPNPSAGVSGKGRRIEPFESQAVEFRDTTPPRNEPISKLITA